MSAADDPAQSALECAWVDCVDRNAFLHVLVGLERIGAELDADLGREEPADEIEHPVLDVLLALIALRRALRGAAAERAAPASTAPCEPAAWSRDLLR